MADAGARRVTRLSRPQRRSQLLNYAAELFAEGGLDAVTMERVAGRAGVSKGLGYAYFENRIDLLRALFDREMEELDASVRQAIKPANTLETRIRAILTAWFEAIADRGPVIYALLGANAGSHPLDDIRLERLDWVIDFLAAVVAKDRSLPPDVARTAGSILLAASFGALDEWRLRGRPRDHAIDVYVTMSVSAIEGLAAAYARRDDVAASAHAPSGG